MNISVGRRTLRPLAAMAAKAAGTILFLTCAAFALADESPPPASADNAAARVTEPARTVHLNWGRGRRALGLQASDVPADEIDRGGPMTFCLDGDDAVLVVDSVPRAIKRIDLTTGDAEVIAPGVVGFSICSLGKDGFVVANDDGIVRIGADGAVKARTALARPIEGVQGYGVGLVPDGQGGAAFQGFDQKTYPVASSTSLTSFTSLSSFASCAAPGRRIALPGRDEPLRFVTKRMDGGRARLLGLDADGEPRVSVPVALDAGVAGAALFKGADSQGRLYVEVERLEPGKPAALEVHRYDPSGAPLAVFALSNQYITTVYKKTEIASDGRVVQMLTTPNGVDFLVYGP